MIKKYTTREYRMMGYDSKIEERERLTKLLENKKEVDKDGNFPLDSDYNDTIDFLIKEMNKPLPVPNHSII